MPIGTVFTIQGLVILLIALYRRKHTIKNILKPIVRVTGTNQYRRLSSADVDGPEILSADGNPKAIIFFETSGPTVVLIAVWTIMTYLALLILLFRLQ